MKLWHVKWGRPKLSPVTWWNSIFKQYNHKNNQIDTDICESGFTVTVIDFLEYREIKPWTWLGQWPHSGHTPFDSLGLPWHKSPWNNNF